MPARGGALTLTYAGAAYLLSFLASVYAIGFVANAGVPRGIDGPGPVPWAEALPVDAALLLLFGAQHSVMARPGFKRHWMRLVPAHAERSTYVLASSLALTALFCWWRPVQGAVWDVHGAAGMLLWALCALGWLTVLSSTFMISHGDLFGLRQALAYARQRAYVPPEFRVRLLYRLVRHPLMLGFIVAFWATPHMSAGHLLFAASMTGYILLALRFEERDLVAGIGAPYRAYQRKVPMLIPLARPKARFKPQDVT